MNTHTGIHPTIFGCLFLLFATVLGAGEAESLAGHIIYAQGEGFEIIRQGQKRLYDPAVDVSEGTELRSGDFINTYNNTFLEILLEPGDRLIRVSEQTSFSIPSSLSIDISYGRIRARVEKLAQGRSFSIRGISTAAGVRGTDFGYDILALAAAHKEDDTINNNEGASLETSIYCFDGTLELKDIKADGALSEEVTVVESGQMVVRNSLEPDAPLAIQPVRQDILSFWQENSFVNALPGDDRNDEPEKAPDPAGLAGSALQYRRAAAVTGVAGALLSSAGALVAFVDPLGQSVPAREAVASGLAISGGIFIATSLLSFFLSLR